MKKKQKFQSSLDFLMIVSLNGRQPLVHVQTLHLVLGRAAAGRCILKVLLFMCITIV